MHFTRLKESDEYQRQREELRVAELNLIEHAERVAALRRTLPADTVVDDYQLIDVASGDGVRLSQLFSAPHRPLILCHFMYGKAQTDPCPLCTMWIDGYNAAAPHVTQNADFVVLLRRRVPPPSLLTPFRAAGATCAPSVRATAPSSTTLAARTQTAPRSSSVSVFTLGDDGSVRHVYSKGAQMADDRRERGIDLHTPVWHLLDLTPNGRPHDWYPRQHY